MNNHSVSTERKLKGCNLSLAVWKFPADRNEFARLLLERAIVLARLGRMAEANKDFAEARTAWTGDGASSLIALRERLLTEQIAKDIAFGWVGLVDQSIP